MLDTSIMTNCNFCRDTIVGRLEHARKLVVVSDIPDMPYRQYVTQMIRDFERLCRKPTGDRLHSMAVEVISLDTLEWDSPAVPAFRCGEWLVELICLIPIHIAVARENRFIPLKNGVLSTDFDNRLLGAEISDIIDAITLGWYESIFRSYMAARPVKVVSSMGMSHPLNIRRI